MEFQIKHRAIKIYDTKFTKEINIMKVMIDKKRTSFIIRNIILTTIYVLSIACLSQAEAGDLPKIVFGTDWFAEGQHGGYYQAVATGIYKKFGLDVKIDMGGPGINGQQLLAAGNYQFYMGSAIDNLVAASHGLPLVTVATIFEKSPACIYAHMWAKNPQDLIKASKILVSANAVDTWWPWAEEKFGYKPSQRGVYTGSVAAFLEDKKIAQQGYYGEEGYTIGKTGMKYRTFLLADYGYPEYTDTIETTRTMIKDHPGIVKKFIEATMLGWKSYLANPAPGNKLIMEANPKQTTGQLAFTLHSMNIGRLLTNKTTMKYGIGTMTNKRWRSIFNLAVRNGIVPSSFNYKKAYTLRFIKKIHIHMG